MKRKRGAGIILAALLVLLAFAAGWFGHGLTRLGEANPAALPSGVTVEDGLLRFRGKVVHPGCVRELSTCIADPLPIVAAVDVEGCGRSNRYHVPFTVEEGVVRLQDEELLGRNAYFEYRHLGELTNGTHVLRTWDCGGGSGSFGDLLLVRFEAWRVYGRNRDRSRIVMRCAGGIGLGDRYDGEISVEGDRIRIGKGRGRAAEQVVAPE
jgi:hypothetical protein